MGMPAEVTLDLTGLWHRETELVGAYTYGTEDLPGGGHAKTFDLALDTADAIEAERWLSATYPLADHVDAIAHAAAAGRAAPPRSPSTSDRSRECRAQGSSSTSTAPRRRRCSGTARASASSTCRPTAAASSTPPSRCRRSTTSTPPSATPSLHPIDQDPLPALLFPGMRLTIAFDDVSLPLPKMRRPDVRQRVIEAVLDLAAAAGVDDVELIVAPAAAMGVTAVVHTHWPSPA